MIWKFELLEENKEGGDIFGNGETSQLVKKFGELYNNAEEGIPGAEVLADALAGLLSKRGVVIVKGYVAGILIDDDSGGNDHPMFVGS